AGSVPLADPPPLDARLVPSVSVLRLLSLRFAPLPFSRPRNGAPGLRARHDSSPQSIMIEKVLSPGPEALADR
ncbi:hypothetical protein, partial [Kitasatospora sp. NPDC088346]|uniref:hypothetical protein n=1 Tax=Kitasatospora sp. NPDC088346 TaxID=3364073 RepID=UPI00381EB19B